MIAETQQPQFSPLKLDVQLPVAHFHVELLLLEIGHLVLVERVVGRQVLRRPRSGSSGWLKDSKSIVSAYSCAFEHDGPPAIALVFAPETGRRIDVDQHVVTAVGHVDRQPALLDADEVLVERVGLEGVEGPPEPGVLPAVAAALAVGLARRLTA